MNFFDMGPLEILLILLVALIIWGPNKIPEIARNLGKTVRAFRKATSDLTATVTRELDLDEKHLPPPPATGNDSEAKETPDTDKTEPADTGTAGEDR